MQIEAFFDPASSTISYLVVDESTAQCAIIDSVLDFDPKSGHTGTTSADRLIRRVRELQASLQWILETHVHADHLSAAAYLKAALGGEVAIGSRVTAVQDIFGKLFNEAVQRMVNAFERRAAQLYGKTPGGVPLRTDGRPGVAPSAEPPRQ